MTEPVYSYVKGQGWVINPGVVFTMACGTVIRLEARKPEDGEKCSWVYTHGRRRLPHERYLLENGVPDLSKWVTAFRDSRYVDVATYEGYPQDRLGPIFVTFVPV